MSPQSVHSVDIGSVRLTERALARHDPPTGATLLAAAGVADAVLAAVELPGVPGTVIGVGGTYTSLSAIVAGPGGPTTGAGARFGADARGTRAVGGPPGFV